MERRVKTALLTLVLSVSASLPLMASERVSPVRVTGAAPQQQGAPAPAEAHPQAGGMHVPAVRKLAPGRYQLGEIRIDKGERTISFPAEVNMEKGLLEYFLVGSRGKTHESLLRTAVAPYTLQLACLLLGMEVTSAPLSAQGAPERPVGDAVQISLELTDGRSVLSEQWVTVAVGEAKRDVSYLQWVYTGSVVNDGGFAAEAQGSIVALYHDPAALIDNASPGGESDTVWYVKEGTVPPVGTRVTVVIRALKGVGMQSVQ